MEGLSLAIGIVLMLVAAIGALCYVALVLAIPVCRLLDGLNATDPSLHPSRQRHGPAPLARLVSSFSRLGAHRIPRLHRKQATTPPEAPSTDPRETPGCS